MSNQDADSLIGEDKIYESIFFKTSTTKVKQNLENKYNDIQLRKINEVVLSFSRETLKQALIEKVQHSLSEINSKDLEASNLHGFILAVKDFMPALLMTLHKNELGAVSVHDCFGVLHLHFTSKLSKLMNETNEESALDLVNYVVQACESFWYFESKLNLIDGKYDISHLCDMHSSYDEQMAVYGELRPSKLADGKKNAERIDLMSSLVLVSMSQQVDLINKDKQITENREKRKKSGHARAEKYEPLKARVIKEYKKLLAQCPQKMTVNRAAEIIAGYDLPENKGSDGKGIVASCNLKEFCKRAILNFRKKK